MTTKPFLLEIGLEELPARFVTPAIEQLEEKMTMWLKENGLAYQSIHTYSTPRRLALLIKGLADKQADVTGEAKGPAKKIALDEQGNWTKAAIGFARGQKVELDQLKLKELNGTEYVFAETFVKGETTVALLPQLEQLIRQLTFAKKMRWNSYDLRFARPIRWLVAIYDKDVVPFSITEVSTSDQTRGHRFLGEAITVTNPLDYEKLLLEQYVIVDAGKRKEAIVNQIKDIERDNQWVIPIEDQLLEEVTNLVEYPTALSGSFETKYLQLPKEVLITTMREHQRYFPVETKEGELQAYFVTVRNGNEANIDTVSKGNEKVLRGRLADAAFFYSEDQKANLSELNKKLDAIVFHESIGTTGEKVIRTKELATWLASQVSDDEALKQTVERAASFAKFDLVTHMVGEFPELQGRMGQDYAEKAGESKEVARAIYEQYLPRFAKDRTPDSISGAILSIADKLDTVVACFAIGLIPTGSQDPYALRRQATGIIQVLLDKNVNLTLEELIEFSLDLISKKGFMTADVESTKEELIRFFTGRLKFLMTDLGYRYDVVDAVLASPLVDTHSMFAKAAELNDQINTGNFKGVTESLSRVTNLAKKAETSTVVSEEWFENDAEAKLLSTTVKVELGLAKAWAEKDAAKAYELLASCRPVIDTFFEETMVMTDDEMVRNNRLALLRRLAVSIQSYADFQQIVFAS
ncbi:glycyl-tRNA synthetase beta chain [Alkalihalobacillus xiaoxiensis]|uniref:Glycine--tRNA ligase beta subunit n=1 Tax=Shouchella xiaoxiensis TaxID=766895 RepID=A0ABS2SRF5_9BACI|nr:glycine--tRNA ligase subunit beta [Shouchella xiaoxiensis]MBM7838105.1 glycyl-tRNA synthetase beta chain [Shouchella xiaoxiensis]